MKPKKLIFGSVAAKHFYPDFPREPKDLDFLCEKGQSKKGTEYAWYGESSQWILDNNPDSEYVIPEFLFTIKYAHAKWDIFWEKTMYDVMFFQKKGVKVNETLYSLLMKDFTEFHGRRWAALKGKNSKTFFEDAVKRKYVHDSIHEAIAYYDRPLYERILKSPGEVACSKEKFYSLSHKDQIRLAKEEIFVTALERFCVPNDFKVARQRAYWLSLKKFITTMSSGWMTRFLVDNYAELYINKDDYITKFQKNAHKLTLNETK